MRADETCAGGRDRRRRRLQGGSAEGTELLDEACAADTTSAAAGVHGRVFEHWTDERAGSEKGSLDCSGPTPLRVRSIEERNFIDGRKSVGLSGIEAWMPDDMCELSESQ